jgi:flagellar motility protein MotE (MotC chaperone)
MRRRVRLLLALVLFVDLVVVAGFLVGHYSPILAQQDEAETGTDDEGHDLAIRDALKLLGEELARRTEELEKREAEANEILRGAEVLRRAGITPEEAPAAVAAAAKEVPVSEAFKKLQRAYENMEPESAALAMIELAGRDQEAVVQLLLGWKPRTSGAILDAITQINSGLAADLSYQIWVRRGKTGPPPGNG